MCLSRWPCLEADGFHERGELRILARGEVKLDLATGLAALALHRGDVVRLGCVLFFLVPPCGRGVVALFENIYLSSYMKVFILAADGGCCGSCGDVLMHLGTLTFFIFFGFRVLSCVHTPSTSASPSPAPAFDWFRIWGNKETHATTMTIKKR